MLLTFCPQLLVLRHQQIFLTGISVAVTRLIFKAMDELLILSIL